MDAAAGRDGGRIILPQWRGNEQFTSMTPRLVNRADVPGGPNPAEPMPSGLKSRSLINVSQEFR